MWRVYSRVRREAFALRMEASRCFTHILALAAIHSKFSPSAGAFSRLRRSPMIRSTFPHGGASMNVSKARSSSMSPRRMREPAVSQKIAIVEKCSQPSLPRGNRFSNSSRLSPSGKVLHHFRASRTESERKMSIKVSNACASCVVGFDMKQETVSGAMRPSHRAGRAARGRAAATTERRDPCQDRDARRILSSAFPSAWSPHFHQVESMTVRISEIGPTEKSFILDFERHPSFLELRHGSVEVLHLETERHRLRRCGGLGLAVRMHRDDRPRSFQFDPFVPISDRLTQPKVVSVELHGLFHILHLQGHFRGGKHTAPRTRSIPANVNLSSPAWRLPCDLEKLDPAPGGRKAEG